MDFVRNFPFFSIMLSMFAGILCSILPRRAARWVNLGAVGTIGVLSAGLLGYLLKTGESYTYLMGHFPAPWGNELRAGMLEADETIEECIARELYEETGLKVRRIIDILHPSYAAVAISDTTTYIAFIEAEGDIESHASNNEEIDAKFYSKDQLKAMLETESFSSRAQVCAWFFAHS